MCGHVSCWVLLKFLQYDHLLSHILALGIYQRNIVKLLSILCTVALTSVDSAFVLSSYRSSLLSPTTVRTTMRNYGFADYIACLAECEFSTHHAVSIACNATIIGHGQERVCVLYIICINLKGNCMCFALVQFKTDKLRTDVADFFYHSGIS